MYNFQQNQTIYPEQNPPSTLIDAALIKAAGDIYHTHCEVHPEITGYASGVAIHRENHRGKVIFKNQPVLLPEERFIPLEQIESCVY